ncbi:hypothetical protein C5188_03865 [Serratia liquefaciens]|nr:hypothetical protein C5188_03865 [Serratia liquefaciens]
MPILSYFAISEHIASDARNCLSGLYKNASKETCHLTPKIKPAGIRNAKYRGRLALFLLSVIDWEKLLVTQSTQSRMTPGGIKMKEKSLACLWLRVS